MLTSNTSPSDDRLALLQPLVGPGVALAITDPQVTLPLPFAAELACLSPNAVKNGDASLQQAALRPIPRWKIWAFRRRRF